MVYLTLENYSDGLQSGPFSDGSMWKDSSCLQAHGNSPRASGGYR